MTDVRLDPELLRAAAMQPCEDFTDPILARRAFDRATRLSRALRGNIDTAGLDIAARSIPRTDGQTIEVRTYSPDSDPAVPQPLLVYLHGGAFVAGDLDTEHVRCVHLAREAGCIVAAVAYRLAPEHPYPTPPEDCMTALRWLIGDESELNVDRTRVAVGGSSAGGTLAAAIALMARDGGGPALALQLLLYPVLDDRARTHSMRSFTDTPGWTSQNNVHMWRHYLGRDHAEAISPYAVPSRCGDLRGLAPAYILLAEFDPLRDEGISYASRLLAAGVPTEVHLFPGTFHGFDVAVPDANVCRRAMRGQIAALQRAFRIPAAG